jgi:hypothetical protein
MKKDIFDQRWFSFRSGKDDKTVNIEDGTGRVICKIKDNEENWDAIKMILHAPMMLKTIVKLRTYLLSIQGLGEPDGVIDQKYYHHLPLSGILNCLSNITLDTIPKLEFDPLEEIR